MSDVVAITGATGLLGRAVLRRCERPVRALVRRGTEPPQGVEVIRGDLSDPAALRALVEGAGPVLHLAAAMGSQGDATLRDVNVEGTRRLLVAAEGHRVVFTSSVAARDPELGAYSRSKADAEDLVLAAGGIVLRIPVLYGPGSQVESTVLGLGRRLPLLPVVAGRPIRPLHVDDAAAACLAALDGGEGRYTLAGPQTLSFPAFAGLLLRSSGLGARVLPMPRPLMVGAAAVLERLLPSSPIGVESMRAAASGTPAPDPRAGADLGFAPRSLAVGLRP